MSMSAGCLVGRVYGHDRAQAHGFFRNGYRRGRTRAVAIALLVTVESIYFAGIWLKEAHHVSVAPLVGGAIVVPIVVFAVSRWQAVYRSEFRFNSEAFHSECA